MKINNRISASFRDPSGFIFYKDNLLYRQINIEYKDNYACLMNSGLYDELVDEGLLITHSEADVRPPKPDNAFKVIKPEPIPFISYPHEWCFSQLKDAALLTLEIQKKSIKRGMSLKDSSAYNVQFRKGKPVCIDTLSFEKYDANKPWVAYRQYCQHFLAPLALMSYKDARLSQLFKSYIDGFPLDLTSLLLPGYTRFIFSLLLHIHLHAGSQKRFAGKAVKINGRKMKNSSLPGLIDSLESAVSRLKWRDNNTEWADYYENTNYSSDAMRHKKQAIAGFLDEINPKNVWDVGANTGAFSRIAGDRGIPVISFDIDPAAVEKNYQECIKKKEANILPLLIDLTNPTPGIGWENKERMSLMERGPADTVFALALIHHLVISNNLPFDKIAEFFGKICDSLIIEFIPKSDSQVQRLLSAREDIFSGYTEEAFRKTFAEYFEIRNSLKIKNTERALYLMRRKNA